MKNKQVQKNEPDFQIIYTSESQLRHPMRFLKALTEDLIMSRDLSCRLFIRDISAQYRQSFFGVLWAFFPPLAMALVLTLANRSRVISVGTTDIAYPVYVIFNMALWRLFVDSLNAPIEALTTSRGLLTKIKFPTEALILSKLGVVGFNFIIRIILIIGIFWWFKIGVCRTIFWVPVSLLSLVFLGTSIGLFLGPVATLYHDITRLLGLGLTAWLFLTPVFYPIPTEGLFYYLVRMNPVTPLLVTTRELVTTGIVSFPYAFVSTGLVAAFGLVTGWFFFRLAMPFVVERFSA